MKNAFLLVIGLSGMLLRLNAQVYPDQQQIIKGGDSLFQLIESKENVELNTQNNSICLSENELEGYFTLKTQSFDEAFNRGLPSWNGSAPSNQYSSFKVLMQFNMPTGWSNWVTVGYWDKEIWASYGNTTFTGGKVNIDLVELNYYITEYRFKVLLKRNSYAYISPEIKQLSFAVSDSKTTSNVNISEIVNDNPPEIFVPTDFVYQYSVDSEIGGSICSPTTVSMILKSFDIEVDTYDFAVRTKDPYFGIFGVWPRVVQHASEYGVNGTVSRIRTWTEAYSVLESGGRIGMSVGKPLYTGHLIMLAGFDSNGNPIVHDPAKSKGYSYKFNKQSLSESWFNKGGVAYVIYKNEAPASVKTDQFNFVSDFRLHFDNRNRTLNVHFDLEKNQSLSFKLYNLQGQLINELPFNLLPKGRNKISLSTMHTNKGIHILKIQTKYSFISKKVSIF